MARSARRSARRFAGALEPYALLRAEVALGRGEVGRLAQAHVTRAYPRVLADLGKMALAGAALELVREIAPARERDERLFDVAVEVLDALAAAESAREEVLLAFQVRVMSIAGFTPGLDVCARCGKRAPLGKAAELDPALGSIVCRACGGGPVHLSGRARERMRACVGKGWATGETVWPGRELAEVRRAIGDHLAAHVGRRLTGPDLVAQVSGLAGGGAPSTPRVRTKGGSS
jgi:DNA repair protein RecO (recombination protein O)